MRVPFALWSAVLAVLVYAGRVALAYRDFGHIDPLPGFALKTASVWLLLVVLVTVAGALRKAFTARPADIPGDVERELAEHPRTAERR